MLRLSKTKYCNACQCDKMLWLLKNKPEEFDTSVMNQKVLDTGNQVGDLAMGLFGPFTEVTYQDDKQMMMNETSKLINENTPIITEASFAYEGKFCSVDIFKKLENNEYEFYEVKSSTKIHDIYYDDVAYQYYVLTKLGYKIKNVYIVNLNKQYVRHGNLDIHQLFMIHDVSSIAKSKYDEVDNKLTYLDTYMANTKEPNKKLGCYCMNPYPCGYFKYCSRKLSKPNVFDIEEMYFESKIKFYENNLITFTDLLSYEPLFNKFKQQIHHELNHPQDEIKYDKLKQFLNIKHPVYFLDLEIMNPAIPLYDNTRPYQQIISHYEVMKYDPKTNNFPKNIVYANFDEDPRRQIAESLCNDIPMNSKVFLYDTTFSKYLIKNLAFMYPDLRNHLLNIYDNIIDLQIPFKNRYYYKEIMHGKYDLDTIYKSFYKDNGDANVYKMLSIYVKLLSCINKNVI